MPAFTVKVAFVADGDTAADAGVVNNALLSERVTTVPPVGAAILRVTVQLLTPLEASVAGLHVNAVGTAEARSPSEKATEAPFRLAVMVAVLAALTAEAVAAKPAVLLPAVTVTDAGVVTDALLSDRVTSAPPVGAAPVRVTVHVAAAGPLTDAGLQLKADTSTECGTVTRPPVAEDVTGMAVGEAEDKFVI